METATAESFSSNQNGATSYRPINNFDHDVDEDFGPETNVDNIDDLMSQPVPTKKSFLDSDSIKTSFSEQLQNDVLDHHVVEAESKNGALEEPVKEIIDNGKAALDEESEEEEEDDEGWDYFKADANSKSTNLSQQKLESSGDLSNEMDYTLNPEAREFVPVSPTKDTEGGDSRSESPELCLRYPVKNTQELLKEEFIASSPMKGQEKNMDDVIVPSMNDFAQEIKKRPSNIMPRFDEDEFSSNNVANHELNNGNALAEESFGQDSTHTSTRAVFGDDSTYSTNLDDVNEALIEKREKSDVAAAFNGDDSNVAQNAPIVDTTSAENHDHPQQNHADDFVSGDSSAGDAFESEDYPSIVEKEQSSPIKEHHHHFGPDGDIFENGTSNITYGRDSGKYDAEKEVPKFDELLMSSTANKSDSAANHSDVFDCLSFNKDSVDEVIQKMSNFDCATTGDRSWLTGDSSQEVTSPTQDLFNGTNPFAASGHNEEKETAEEKEIAAPAQDQHKYDAFDAFGAAPSNDRVDFQSNAARDPFQSIFGDASAPAAFDKPVEETITAEKVHDVETGGPVKAPEAPSQVPNNDISAQILDMREYDDQVHKSEDTEIVPTTSENQVPAGGPETPVGSEDLVTPYVHDCTRLGEKHDSVHEHVHKKHFEDLLPDDEQQNGDATKESDKLASELRESSSGKRLEFDLGFHDGAASASGDLAFDNDAGDEFHSLMCNLATSKTTPSAPVDDKIVEETPSMEAAAAQAVDDQPAAPACPIDNELSTTTKEDKPADGGLVTPPPTAALSTDPEVHVSIAEAVDKLVDSRTQDEQKSADSGAVAAAAVAIGAATAGVAVAGAVAATKREPSKKPYIIRRPDPNKPAAPKAPAAPAAKPPATKSTTSAPKPTARSTTTAPKKPTLSSTSSTTKTATTPTKSTTARPLGAAPAKPSTPRTSLTASKTSSSTLASKPSPRPAAPKSLTSPSKPTRPLVGSVTSPRTAAAKPITNGDVTSSSAARTATSTTRRPLSATGTAKKLPSPTSSAPAPHKPAVNLATRTSLAPKPKTTTTTTTSADKKPIAKRPLSASSSLAASRTTTVNKDSKDITNKRISRPASATSATKTVTKTESKVNTGLIKTTANAKKVSSTEQTTNNQIDSTKINGNA